MPEIELKMGAIALSISAQLLFLCKKADLKK